MIDNNATARLHEEIGTDPAAYEAKMKAKWEAEFQAAIDKRDGRVSPAAGLPPEPREARDRHLRRGARMDSGWATLNG